MPNKMLIDASHPEETRVVVLRGNKVEEFDFESASKKPLRGNIYLAKVMRVEPSLQAAFVDYGGNRHGFLAFSEIHPDYYQIPVADRQALLEEDARADAEEEEDRSRGPRRSRRNRNERSEKRQSGSDETISTEAVSHDEAADTGEAQPYAADLHTADESAQPRHEEGDLPPRHDEPHAEHRELGGENGHHAEHHANEPHDHKTHEDEAHDDVAHAVTEIGGGSEGEDVVVPASEGSNTHRGRHQSRRSSEDHEDEAEAIEQMGGDAMEEMPRRAPRHRRNYKIQEVIKRRQVLLVQVVKEERGNKGAALTTYLSLAGRYSVLMPNTAQGGGISRKITNSVDRKRLKEISGELEVPDGMGIILRTAGAARTKTEVKRDFEYLIRMWEQVRELTLKSTAPMLTYEEGSLIKRSIRDLYGKEIEEVVVAGEAGYREAKDFMRMLMPSHAKNVQAYRDPQPIFARSGVEAQLDAMFSNQVTLKSGGYIVINQTEALVAIDVNSGRSTREHNIEDTALRTNVEAADEVARQLRLRDLAGLIVVDFIDMEESRNNRTVERRIKDALKNDRARIQIGRISHFGLLEMSRQRIRTGVLEGSTVQCQHCLGAGHVRSTASVALHVLRIIEDALLRSNSHNVNVRARTIVALYILNQKRLHLRDLERRFGVTINIGADDALTGLNYHTLERGEIATPSPDALAAGGAHDAPADEADAADEDVFEAEEEEIIAADGGEEAEAAEARPQGRRRERDRERPNGDAGADGEGEAGRRNKRRRRRRGRGRDERDGTGVSADAPQPSDDGLEMMARVEGDLSDNVQARPARAEGDEAVASEAAEGGEASASEGTPFNGEGPRREGPRGRSRGGRGRFGRGRDERPRDDRPREERPRRDGARSDEPREAAADHMTETAAEAPAPAAGAWVPAETLAQAAPPPRHEERQAPEPEAQKLPREQPVSTDIDPAAPKRSGWWSRAKASFGAE